jgi:hypothetical protein
MVNALPTNLLSGLFSGSIAPPAVAAERRAQEAAASGGAAGESVSDKPTSDKPAAPAGDSINLSPAAKALAVLKGSSGTDKAGPVAPTEVSKAQRARFDEAAKEFLAQSLGFSPSQVQGFEINDEARRYIARNTVLGALAPPELRRELGIDVTGRGPKPAADPAKRELASFSLTGNDGSTLARIAFDPRALEEFARLPKAKKDLDGDRLFTPNDLFPLSKPLKPDEKPSGDIGNRFAAQDTDGGWRTTLSDGAKRTFVFGRFQEGDLQARPRTVALVSALVQFAGFSPA